MPNNLSTLLPPQQDYAQIRLEQEILTQITAVKGITTSELQNEGTPLAGPRHTTYALTDTKSQQKGTVSIGGRIDYVSHELDPSLNDLEIKLQEYSNETCDQKRNAYAQEYIKANNAIERRLNSLRSREVKDYNILSDIHKTAGYIGCGDVLLLYDLIDRSSEENTAQSLKVKAERISEIKDQLHEIIGEETIQLYDKIY
jgi:hypothetical protein